MKMPSAPRMRPKQRHAGRFWNTADVMELLSIYHGATARAYPVTWQYRTLIAFHRSTHSASPYGKGYGPDWKSLKRQESGGKVRWVPDGGFAIKQDLLEYGRQGRVPAQALQLAAAEIRKAEFRLWVDSRVESRSRKAA